MRRLTQEDIYMLALHDLARIEEAVPANAVAGERCAPAAMAQLDSERRTTVCERLCR
jgi:hypothetical protein